jgi:magnesium-transporting ATPase (P-type)
MKTSLALRIAQIFFYILMAVSVIVIVMFYVKNGNVNPDDPIDKQMVDMGGILNTFTLWSYFMIAVAVFFTLIFPIINMFSNPKSGLKSLLSLAIMALVLFVGYQLADDTIMQIPGYDGHDNVPQTLKLTGMGVYTMYIMLGGTVLAVLYSSVSKLLR